MLEILFGPDGVGKTTIAKNAQHGSKPAIVLHGTNTASWFSGAHEESLRSYGFDESHVPADDDLTAKILLVP